MCAPSTVHCPPSSVVATTLFSLPAVPTKDQAKPRPVWLDTWRRYARNTPAVLGLFVIAFLLLMAIFGPSIAPYDYARTDLDHVDAPPSAQHWLGTDDLGRDMLTRMIYGARSVVFVIVIVSLTTFTLGLILGGIAGYLGGVTDTLISRLIELVLAFPSLLFIFFIAATIKPGVVTSLKAVATQNNWQWLTDFVRSGYADYLVVMIALSVIGWAGLARLVRGQILSLRERDFVKSAELVGVQRWRILMRYLLPNALPPIIVLLSMSIGDIALSEGILSYLGIGLQPPNPSWGNILADNIGIHWRDWPAVIWLIVIPFLIMATVVFAFNFVGDGLNDALNPELS